jgi:PhnB protein
MLLAGVDSKSLPRHIPTARGESMANVKPIPDGYRNVTPYLFIKGAAKAIDFYKSVFGATERMRMPTPDGKIGHAELMIGDSVIMLADEHPQMHSLSLQTVGGTPICLHIYVNNVDDVVKKATNAGSNLLQPIKNQFYGDRSGTFTDPFGHMWSVATHVEDVSPEELQRRAAKAMSAGA